MQDRVTALAVRTPTPLVVKKFEGWIWWLAHHRELPRLPREHVRRGESHCGGPVVKLIDRAVPSRRGIDISTMTETLSKDVVIAAEAVLPRAPKKQPPQRSMKCIPLGARRLATTVPDLLASHFAVTKHRMLDGEQTTSAATLARMRKLCGYAGIVMPEFIGEPEVGFLLDWTSVDSGGAGQISPKTVSAMLGSRAKFAARIRERAEAVTADPETLLTMLRYADSVQRVVRDDEDRVRARLEDLRAKGRKSKRDRGIASVYRGILADEPRPAPALDEERETARRLPRRVRVGLFVMHELQRFGIVGTPGHYIPSFYDNPQELCRVTPKNTDCDSAYLIGVTLSSSAASCPDLLAVGGAFSGAPNVTSHAL